MTRHHSFEGMPSSGHALYPLRRYTKRKNTLLQFKLNQIDT